MTICSIYSTDPRGNKIGGIETHVVEYLKFAEADVKFVGIDTIGNKKIGEWSTIKVGNKEIPFFPVLYEPKDVVNRQRLFPLTLRFLIKLFLYKNRIIHKGDILDFQRIEHMIPFITNAKSNRIYQFIHGSSAHLFIKTGTSVEKYKWIYVIAERILLKYCKKIFLVSPEGYYYYRTKYPSLCDKFIEMSSSVNTEQFRQEKDKKNEYRKSFSISDDSKVILFVGRIHGVKDPRLLFESFKKILDLEPKAILCIVGPGKIDEFIEINDENKFLLNKVFQIGALFGEELNKIYNCADVFLLTSKYEGMPRCVLEALQVGVPVVSVVVGSIRKLIKNGYNGFIVESRNPDEISTAVKKVIELQLSLSNNVSKSVERYSSYKVFNRLVKLQIES
jgi:glycosyltransferase involved in cell wall biosynthesis